MIRIKRAYEPASKADGRRVLVDRLWPRGVSKEKLRLADWLKNVAPSEGLRKWFGHDPERWGEFRKRYRAELGQLAEELAPLRAAMREGSDLTLIYSARDEAHNQAVVLKEFLEESRK